MNICRVPTSKFRNFLHAKSILVACHSDYTAASRSLTRNHWYCYWMYTLSTLYIITNASQARLDECAHRAMRKRFKLSKISSSHGHEYELSWGITQHVIWYIMIDVSDEPMSPLPSNTYSKLLWNVHQYLPNYVMHYSRWQPSLD